MKTKYTFSQDALKILGFFMNNPTSIDTPRGVSAWTNTPYSDTANILENFTKQGILRAFRTSSTVGFSLTENKKILNHLKQVLKKHSV